MTKQYSSILFSCTLRDLSSSTTYHKMARFRTTIFQFTSKRTKIVVKTNKNQTDYRYQFLRLANSDCVVRPWGKSNRMHHTMTTHKMPQLIERTVSLHVNVHCAFKTSWEIAAKCNQRDNFYLFFPLI